MQWCVPSHLISYGPEIAKQIKQGLGVVCERKFRAVIQEEQHDVDKWKRRAKEYKKTLDKDLDAVSQVCSCPCASPFVYLCPCVFMRVCVRVCACPEILFD